MGARCLKRMHARRMKPWLEIKAFVRLTCFLSFGLAMLNAGGSLRTYAWVYVHTGLLCVLREHCMAG